MAPGYEGHGQMNIEMMRKHYRMLGLNLMTSLAIMYLVMFAMIWTWGEFIQNINFFYMALMMWAPMGSLMLLTMRSMYQNKKLNMVLHAVFAAIFFLSFVGIREQGLVGDSQFLRSMIPHHSGAILMCEEAAIADPGNKQLCVEIFAESGNCADEGLAGTLTVEFWTGGRITRSECSEKTIARRERYRAPFDGFGMRRKG